MTMSETLEERTRVLLEYIAGLQGREFTQKQLADALEISSARVSDILIVLSTCYLIQRQRRGFTFDVSQMRRNFAEFTQNVQPGRGDTIQEAAKTVVYSILTGAPLDKSRRTYDVLSVLRAADVVSRQDSAYRLSVLSADGARQWQQQVLSGAIIDKATQERTIFDTDYFTSQ